MLRRRDACLEPTLPGRSLRQGRLDCRQLGLCTLWLTAEQGVTSPAGLVAEWEDQSSGGVRMVVSGAHGLPSFSHADATFRSMPAVEFSPAAAPNGSDRLQSISYTPLKQPNTVAIVFQNQKSNASNISGWITSYGSGGSAANQIWCQGDAGGTKHTVKCGAGASAATTTEYALNVGRSTVALFNGASAQLWVDGVHELENANFGTANFDLIGIGDLFSTDNEMCYFDGKIAELAVWNRVLSAGEIQAVTDAWAAKYGVAQ